MSKVATFGDLRRSEFSVVMRRRRRRPFHGRRREDRPFNADAAEVDRTIGLADRGDALRESPENSLGMIRVFCSTPLRCGFGFESWSRGGDDENGGLEADPLVSGGST